MTIFDITTDPGPYPQPWGLLDDDAQTIDDGDTTTLPQARITAFKMYELLGAGATGITDDDAIHDNVAAEISAIAEKTVPISADLVVIEDSAAANAKKRVQVGNLPGGDITTDPAFDAKGDLIGGTGADTAARLAVGTDGYHLVADSAEATGLNWEAPPSGGGGTLQFTELLDQTFTGQSSVDVDCTGYDQIQLIWQGVGFSASSGLRLRTSSDGFSADLGDGATEYVTNKLDDDENISADASTMAINATAIGTANRHGNATVFNLASATHETHSLSVASSDTGNVMGVRRSYRKTAQVDTHIRILPTTGTIDSGQIRVLGIGASNKTSATASTTDATVTTCGTIATASNAAYHVDCIVVGRETVDSDEVASYSLKGTFKNDGGTLTLVGSVSATHAGEDTAGWDATLDASGTDIRCRVTGAAATNIDWASELNYKSV